MSNAATILATSDPGAGAAIQVQRDVEADAGAAVHRPDGLCVRSAELSPLREAEREVDFIMSTNDLDSYGERVTQNWDLTRFLKNPVALWSHQNREFPVGHWKNVRVENGALRGTLKIATAAANPKAENIFHLIKEGALRAVSVGFVPGKVTYEEHDGQEVCILDMNCLHECSPCSIPANENALIQAKARAKAAYLAERTKPSPPPSEATPTTMPITSATKAKEAPVSDPQNQNDVTQYQKLATDADLRARTAETDRAKAVEERTVAVAERDAARTAEKAAVERAVSAEKAAADLRVKLLAADIEPLIGVKVAPAERDALVELAGIFAAQGDAGAAKWKTHLDAQRSRPDLAQRTGGSVLPGEPGGRTDLATAGANDGELASFVNAAAHSMPSLLAG